ncbi:MAG: oligosaccharide flippase family protein [Candidatus Hydrogenedentota bacterium]
MNSLYDFDVTPPLLLKRFKEGIYLHILDKLRKLIFLPFFTRMLDTAGIGILNLIYVTCALIMPVFELNLKTGAIPFLSEEKNQEEIYKILNAVVFYSLLSTLILCLAMISPILMNDPHLLNICLAFAFYVFSNNLKEVSSLIHQSFQKTEFLLKFLCIIGYLSSIVSIVFLFAGLFIPGIIWAESIVMFGSGLWLLYVLFKSGWKFNLNFSKKFNDILNLSISTTPVRLFQWIIRSLDSYLILLFYDTSSVGIYAVAYMFASPVLSFEMAINFMWVPNFSRLYSESKDKALKMIKRALKFITLSFVSIIILYLILLKKLIIIIAGNEYVESYLVCLIIVLAFFFYCLGKLFEGVLFSFKKGKSIFSAYLTGMILNVMFNIILIPVYALKGASVATLISYCATFLIMYLRSR